MGNLLRCGGCREGGLGGETYAVPAHAGGFADSFLSLRRERYGPGTSGTLQELCRTLIDSSCPIIQLAPLRPKGVKGLTLGPTTGQKQSWDSNSREGPKASTPATVTSQQGGPWRQGQKKAGMFQRPGLGYPALPRPGPHPPPLPATLLPLPPSGFPHCFPCLGGRGLLPRLLFSLILRWTLAESSQDNTSEGVGRSGWKSCRSRKELFRVVPS